MNKATITSKKSRQEKYSRQLKAAGICCRFVCGHHEDVLPADIGTVTTVTLNTLFPTMEDNYR
jgi:hypothetical protein